MNHESECCITPENPLALPNFYCICDRLESAYKRGRKDAAKIVEIERGACPVGWDTYEWIAALIREDGEHS